MSQTAKAQEPSMEEILASIRRIIADEDGGKAAKAPEPAAPPPAAVPARPAPPPPPPAAFNGQSDNGQSDLDAMLADLDDTPPRPAPKTEPEPVPEPAKPVAELSVSDVLDLTEEYMAPTPPPGPAPSFRTIDGDPDVVFTDRAPEPPEPAARTPEEARRPLPQSPVPAPAPAPDPGLISNATAAAVDSAFNSLAHTVFGQNARTLEDLVKEMLRPLLKSWLDDNLPSMVERIVRTEIERVSRGKP